MTDIATILPPRDGLPEGWELLPKTLMGTDNAVVDAWPDNGRGYVRLDDDGDAVVMLRLDAENLLTVSVSHTKRQLSKEEALNILAELLKTRDLDYVEDPGSEDDCHPLYFVVQVVD